MQTDNFDTLVYTNSFRSIRYYYEKEKELELENDDSSTKIIPLEIKNVA